MPNVDFGDVRLPGFGLPLEPTKKWSRQGPSERLPHAIADFFATAGITLRELRMLDFINQITDKPLWWEKIYNDEILGKWRNEACGTVDQQKHSDKHLSPKCFDFCVEELRDKAAYLQKTGTIHVLDVDATVVKSDTEPTDPFWQALSAAVHPLEGVPDRKKDWHPGSDGKVLDLLHPSLFPLHYGTSRVLTEGTVPLIGCAEYSGRGEICPIPDAITSDAVHKRNHSWGNEGNLKPWGSYQWLPTNISFDKEGKANINSYINNLQPETHRELYRVLATAVDRAVPLWTDCISYFHDRTRIEVGNCGYEDFAYPGFPPEDTSLNRNSDDEEDSDDAHEEDSWEVEERQRNHLRNWINSDQSILNQPEVTREYTPLEQFAEAANQSKLDLKNGFGGLQVIFKLANIHLTPEQPTYDGSNWHVEGALNEHICATALFYYDQENIADTFLEFRTSVDCEELIMKPSQNEYVAAERLFGVQQDGEALQVLGKVATRPYRTLAFPNVLQHRVKPFSLADPSKPGHRKILAMFLVDPHVPILSTANVPPQRRDWWAEEVRKVPRFAALPAELFERIMERVDGFPISWDKACEMREELMAERGRISDDFNSVLQEDTFFFCEH